MPRHTAGRIITPGHVGIIYQAANAVYTGRSAARTITLLPDGTVLNDRTAVKIRRQERGHRAAEARLIALGARAPRAGQPIRAWLDDALEAIGAHRYRHGGCHRYAFTIGPRRHQVQVGLLARAYPKNIDPAAD